MADRRTETAALVAQAAALLPFVSEERRRRFRALVERLRAGTHGVGLGSSFDAKVRRDDEWES